MAPVEIFVTPQNTFVFSTQTVQLGVTDSRGPSDVVWSVTSTGGGSGVGTVGASGLFTAPRVVQNTTNIVIATSKSQPSESAAATITVIAPGQIATTNNPQVALYTFTPPAGTSSFIQFGTSTSYGLGTWAQPAPTSGGTLSFLVAGMLANTEYHLSAVVGNGQGYTANDLDHTFTTQSIPANQMPSLTVTTTSGSTPQAGIEMLDLSEAYPRIALAGLDLSGNLLWSYPAQGTSSDSVQGVHLLPNGHFLMGIDPTSTAPLDPGSIQPDTINVLQEIDLAGNVIHQETLDELNAALPAAGFDFTTVGTFHHDVIALPNGHWIALGNILEPCVGLPQCSADPNILGDVLIDLAPQADGTFLPVWAWNSFDHLDVSRAPAGYPDWTHSNAILYSFDDGNLLLSIRHQSWIIKIDYANGTGSGDIIWHLGEGGDFTLVGGTDPTDWFYGQHGPSFATTNTTGNFDLAVMDNGYLRVFPPGVTCGSPGEPVCNYSTSPLLAIDETAKTATILSNYLPGEYSLWGGNAEQLANGDIEGDFNAGAPGGLSDIFEVTGGSNPQVVWHLRTGVQNAYRGFRLPSLYPGVVW